MIVTDISSKVCGGVPEREIIEYETVYSYKYTHK